MPHDPQPSQPRVTAPLRVIATTWVLASIAAACTPVDEAASPAPADPSPVHDAGQEQATADSSIDAASDTAPKAADERDDAQAGPSDAIPDDEDAGVSPAPGMPCHSNAECDDHQFCNGVELCLPSHTPGDPLARCIAGEPPCHLSACDDIAQRCDCAFRNGDGDQDGHPAITCGGDDCDDNNAAIYPGVTEWCDEVDDDCDPDTIASERGDADGDGHTSAVCANPRRDVQLWNAGTDYDDDNPQSSPDAAEVCDGIDNNCNGMVDEVGGVEDHSMAYTFFRDDDKDGFGVMNGGSDTVKAFCGDPVLGWSLNNYDCNDTTRSVSPSRPELCNGIDDNCDREGLVDEEPLEEKPDFPGTALECRGLDGWVITRCPDNAGDCNANVGDGCETPLDTLCDCRQCGVSCTFACGERGCEEISSLAIGFAHTCAVTAGAVGTAACWGLNQHGQLGDDTVNNSATPRPVARISGVRKVVAGYYHSCAIAEEERALYCWGDQTHGQLGTFATAQQSTIPVAVIGIPSGAMSGVVDVAAGDYHTCVVLSDNGVACWGQADAGRLGDGSVSQHDASAPSLVRAGQAYLREATHVAAGGLHSCAIVGADKRVYCWGNNALGQLGDGTRDTRAQADAVLELSDVDQLALGSDHSCALSHGVVYCWGSNSYGQIGGDAAYASAPRAIEGVANIVALTTGEQHSCAVDADGAAYCWGLNSNGELGQAQLPQDASRHPTPVRVDLAQAQNLYAGPGQHMCAIASEGAVCWGKRDVGQLGTGTSSSDNAVSPVTVTNLADSKTCDK